MEGKLASRDTLQDYSREVVLSKKGVRAWAVFIPNYDLMLCWSPIPQAEQMEE